MDEIQGAVLEEGLMEHICANCRTEMVSVCPTCNKPVDVFSRVVGYLRPVSCWNAGKQQEWRDRQEFIVGDE